MSQRNQTDVSRSARAADGQIASAMRSLARRRRARALEAVRNAAAPPERNDPRGAVEPAA